MPPDYSRMRDLVVDDNAFTRRSIRARSRNLGFKLEYLAEASDGLTALNVHETATEAPRARK